MKIEQDKIIDFNNGYLLDSVILSCFLDEDDHILFPYLPWNRQDNFIEERKVFTSTVSTYHHSMVGQQIWYKAKNYYDLYQILSREGITYSCMIISKYAKSAEEYKFLIDVYEHGIYESEEYRILYILDEKIKGSFIEFVAPKIQSLRIELFDTDDDEDEN
jgi:hypothetical protein